MAYRITISVGLPQGSLKEWFNLEEEQNLIRTAARLKSKVSDVRFGYGYGYFDFEVDVNDKMDAKLKATQLVDEVNAAVAAFRCKVSSFEFERLKRPMGR